MNKSLLVACLALLPLFSCSFDFNNVPEGAQIMCNSNADCPGGWICNTIIGMCASKLDPTMPNFDPDNPPTVTPNILKAGATAKLEFGTDKELAKVPDVAIKIGGKLYPMNQVPDESSGNIYVFSYAAVGAGTEEQGVYPVLVTMVDKSGNKAEGLQAGLVEFDFTPPGIQPGSTIQYLSDYPNNPVLSVSALTNGTTAVVSFSLDEDLAADSPKPNVVFCKVDDCDPSDSSQVVTLTLDTGISSGRFFRFTGKVDGIAPDQKFASKLYLTPGPTGGIFDKAGNEQNDHIVIAKAAVNTFKPFTPTIANVYYKRIPWGMKSPKDGSWVEKKFSVNCNACQFSSDTQMVLVYDSATPSTGGLIGSFTNPGTGGAWGFPEIVLNGSDRAHVWLAAADTAGNISPAVEIKDAEWIATMGYKVPGSTLENPNVFSNVGMVQKTLKQGPYFDEPEAFQGTTFKKATEYGRQYWWNVTPPEVIVLPTPRKNHALAYDSIRGKVVLFGGDSGSIRLNDTWEWDGLNWVEKLPVVNPPARHSHSLAYDSARGRTVLFGGYGGGDYFNDTWEWDGANWRQLTPAISPPAQAGHSLAYDSSTGRTILLGADGNAFWKWDGVNWTESAPSTRPVDGGALAYDSARRKMILFTGSQTWEWDGVDWAQKATADSPLGSGTLAYDSVRGKAVLFTGSQTWEWDGVNWLHKVPAESPPVRPDNALAYDAARGKTIMFGGGGFNDTWEWDGENWSRKKRTGSPYARDWHMLAYDSLRGKTVLFGGEYFDGSTHYYNDTWEWDGMNWTQKNPAKMPPAMARRSMTYDTARGKTVLFAGSEMWEWDGVNWLQKIPVTIPPGGGALAYDDMRGKTVLYTNDQTWEWDGENWSKKVLAGNPTSRVNNALTYDSARYKTVLYGGYWDTLYLQDTWEYDGVNWRIHITAINPPSQSSTEILFDSARGKTVLVTGYDFIAGLLNNIWEWDGVKWVKKISASSPPARDGYAIAYDIARGKMVFFGGYNGSYFPNDTWEWDGQGNGKAGQLTEIAIQSSGVFKVESKPQVQQIEAKFVSGGSGYPWDDVNKKVNTTHGVNLMAWYDNEWHSLASNSDSAAVPGLVEWSTTDPVMVDKLYYGGGMKYNFAVVPIAPNGFGDPDCVDPATTHCDMGQVSTEYMEVTVKYTLP